MTVDAFPYERRFSIGVSFDLCFAPDDSALFVVGRRLERWDALTGKRTSSVAWSNGSGLDVSSDGTRVVATNTSGDVIMLDAETMEQLWIVRGREFGEGSAPRFSPDGSAFVTGSWAGDLVVRDTHSGEVMLHERGGGIHEIACSPNRQLFAIPRRAGRSGTGAAIELRRWPFADHDAGVISLVEPVGWLAFDAAGRFTAKSRSGLAIYDARHAAILAEAAPIGRDVDGVAWGPDGELLVVSRQVGVVALDAQTRSPIWSHELPYACAAVTSPSGALLALGSWEQGMVVARTGAKSIAYDETAPDDEDPHRDSGRLTDHERWIAGYVEIEANEHVVQLANISSEDNDALHHEIWDVQCESSRWWAITEPLAAYDAIDHPDPYEALAFHLRVRASSIADRRGSTDKG